MIDPLGFGNLKCPPVWVSSRRWSLRRYYSRGMSVKLFLCVSMSNKYLFIVSFTEILRTTA